MAMFFLQHERKMKKYQEHTEEMKTPKEKETMRKSQKEKEMIGGKGKMYQTGRDSNQYGEDEKERQNGTTFTG